MNNFLNGMKSATNYTYTENGALTHKSSMSGLLDLFGLGAAYRSRSDNDCIVLFQKAFAEDPTYALKCLFYLRDIRGGQGERRFFRVILHWLASYDKDAVIRNLQYIPEYGRYDDLFVLIGTPIENEMWNFVESEVRKGLEIVSAIKDE